MRIPGTLLIIGGAEDRKYECRLLNEFVRLSGDAAANLMVVTTATNHGDEVGAEYVAAFKKCNQNLTVEVWDIQDRESANAPAAIEALRKASGVFFTGGDQGRLINVLGGSQFDVELHKRWEDGVIVGGTSAGASAMATVMIVEGDAALWREDQMVIGAGLEFLPGIIIDQHFAERGRINRLITAVSRYRHYLGVGIDEDTAILLQGSAFQVLGKGSVVVIDAGAASKCQAPEGRPGDSFQALLDLKIHVLLDGYGFDLTERRPVQPHLRGHHAHRETSSHSGSESLSLQTRHTDDS